jgi:hypothetical protein
VGTNEEGGGLFIDVVGCRIKEEIAELKSVVIIAVGIHHARFWGRKHGVSRGTQLSAGEKGRERYWFGREEKWATGRNES